MRFAPKTAKEVDELGLLPDGVYDFLVTEATDAESKSGNEMVVLKLRIEGDDGRNFTIIDYLVAIDSMAYKIRHFADSVGLLDAYDKGDLPAEVMVGCVGKAKIGVQPAKGEYRAKNVIKDYIAGSAATGASKPAMAELDDEIPF